MASPRPTQPRQREQAPEETSSIRVVASPCPTKPPQTGQAPGETAQARPPAPRGRAHGAGPTSSGGFGVSPWRSGAYMASTRLGGSRNTPSPFSRRVYCNRVTPAGR